MQNRKTLSNLIKANVRWYDHQAPAHHAGKLNMTWIEYVAKLTTEQWRAIKSASNSISLKDYQHTLRLLQDMETTVIGKQYRPSNHEHASFKQAKMNARHLLAKVNQRPKRIITMIKVQKHKGRFNVYLDHRYAFPVSEYVLTKYHLHEGMHITKATQNKLSKADNFSKMYNTAINYLAGQLRTKHEILVKLQDKYPNATLATINRVIRRLKIYHLVDDQHYANAYVRTSTEIGKKGPYRILPYLKRKGIKDSTAQKALADYYSNDKQLEVAQSLAKNKYKMSSNQPFRKRITKAKQYLQRKGFDFDIINDAVDQCDFQPDIDKQRDILRDYTKKAFRKYANRYNGFKRTLKIKQYLVRQGFSFDDADNAIDTYKEDHE